MEDFNEILEDSEKWWGARKPRVQMEDFKNSLEHCQLCDMGFVGLRFTWANNRYDHQFMRERLDKAVANKEWCESFSTFIVEVLAACTSNHAPIFASLKKETRFSQKKKGISS